MIKVTVWNEFCHEKEKGKAGECYPQGIHNTIADFLKSDEIFVRTATLDQPNCGLSEEILKDTDVLIWWGHMRHNSVPDEIAAMVQRHVLCGMGFIALHSAHHSKPFKLLMGTTCNLSWREDGDYEYLWTVAPGHPIAKGLGRYIYVEHEETYSEPFEIPEPDKLIFIGSFEGGEVMRAGCCYRRQHGKIFYFQPGHETFPIYHNKDIQTVIRNAVYWAAPDYRVDELVCPQIEKIK